MSWPGFHSGGTEAHPYEGGNSQAVTASSLAPKIAAPLLCVVAAHDEVIPVEHARRLYDAWGGPKRWIELAAGHNSLDNQPDYWPSIRAFLAAR